MADLPDYERRQVNRVPFETEVTVSTDNLKVKVKGSSKDLSLKGIFINTDIELSDDSECEVEIKLAGSTENITIYASGTIARKEKEGVGIHFESIDLDSYVHLKNILKYNSAESEVAE